VNRLDEYLSPMTDAELDRIAIENFRGSPPEFLTIPVKKEKKTNGKDQSAS
jgi:hypothetical protein